MSEQKGPTFNQQQLGGETTKRRRGLEFYAEIGRLGGLAKAKNKSAKLNALREAAERGEIG